MNEIARQWSPYQYAYLNPIRFIDPDGMVIEEPDIEWNRDTKTVTVTEREYSEPEIVSQNTNTNEDGSYSITTETSGSVTTTESVITEEGIETESNTLTIVVTTTEYFDSEGNKEGWKPEGVRKESHINDNAEPCNEAKLIANEIQQVGYIKASPDYKKYQRLFIGLAVGRNLSDSPEASEWGNALDNIHNKLNEVMIDDENE